MHTFSIQVANSRLVRQGTSFDLTVNAQTSPTRVATQRVNLVKATELTLTVSENPTDSQLLGRLPARLRAPRMQYSVVGFSNWYYLNSKPINVTAGGRIVAQQPQPVAIDDSTFLPSNRTNLVTGLDPSSSTSIWFVDNPNLFDYESIPQTPANPPHNGVIHSGDVLVAVYDPLLKTTEHVLVHVQLRNVDEAPTTWNQSIQVGLDGTGGKIYFNDPDARYGGQVRGNDGFSGPHEMKIVGGDIEGIFTIPAVNVGWYGSAHQLKIAKPELLNGRDTFTLQVQLYEKGKLAGEATIQVKVLPTVSDITIYARPRVLTFGLE
jgi:hypothetical protein